VPAKPSPDAALALCESLGVLPGEVAYFGDTSTDVKTAKAFAAEINVGVSWGFRGRDELISEGADVILDHPLEIVNLVLNK
jgi:phosphoglycolate phosphatase